MIITFFSRERQGLVQKLRTIGHCIAHARVSEYSWLRNKDCDIANGACRIESHVCASGVEKRHHQHKAAVNVLLFRSRSIDRGKFADPCEHRQSSSRTSLSNTDDTHTKLFISYCSYHTIAASACIQADTSIRLKRPTCLPTHNVCVTVTTSTRLARIHFIYTTMAIFRLLFGTYPLTHDSDKERESVALGTSKIRECTSAQAFCPKRFPHIVHYSKLQVGRVG